MFYQTDDFLNNLIKLVRECNTIILNVYKTNFDVTQKTDNSPLTIADKLVNEHICKYLSSFKNTLIISEENKNAPYSERKNNEFCWLVDPLDGTKEFIKKNGQFTVNIGLVRSGTPVFGIVSIPVSGEIYYGIDSVGSFKISENCKKKLSVQIKDFSDKNLNIVSSLSHTNKMTTDFIKQFSDPNIVTIGSSIKLLYIAEGKADIYPRLSPTYEWDTCAAHAVIKYAGGRLVNYDEKNKIMLLRDDIIYNKENLLNPFFIAY